MLSSMGSCQHRFALSPRAHVKIRDSKQITFISSPSAFPRTAIPPAVEFPHHKLIFRPSLCCTKLSELEKVALGRSLTADNSWQTLLWTEILILVFPSLETAEISVCHADRGLTAEDSALNAFWMALQYY